MKILEAFAAMLAIGVFQVCAEQPEIVGGVSDGVPVEPSTIPQPTLPELEVVETVSLSKEGRRITFNKVQPPLLPQKEKIPVSTSSFTPKQIQEFSNLAEESIWLNVAATAYDEDYSFVTWWIYQNGEQKKFTAWSNINWNHLVERLT